MTMGVMPESPYFHQDALNDKIVHEILVPSMFRQWFLNRERPGWMGCREEAYHIPYGNQNFVP